jgi:hypothetical protein
MQREAREQVVVAAMGGLRGRGSPPASMQPGGASPEVSETPHREDKRRDPPPSSTQRGDTEPGGGGRHERRRSSLTRRKQGG